MQQNETVIVPISDEQLHIDRIVETAIAVIDEFGLEGCTMRRLAERLSVTPMSIYRHVRNKEELLQWVPEYLFASGIESVRTSQDAMSALRAVANGLQQSLKLHPNIAPLVYVPRPGPKMTAALGHCVRLLAAEGCPPEKGFGITRSLVALVVGLFVTSDGIQSAVGLEVYLSGVESLLEASDPNRSAARSA